MYCIAALYFIFPFICSEKNLLCAEHNKYYIPFLFAFLFVFHSFFYSWYISWSMCVNHGCKNGTWPNTFNQLQFAASLLLKPTAHFHSISRARAFYSLSLSLYTVTKFIAQKCAPPFVRLTRSFAQRRIRTTFTKSTFIWFPGEVAFLHTRTRRHRCPFCVRFSDTAEYSPCFITFAITPLSGSPESWNHLYINLPLFNVITAQCYYIPGCGTYTRRHTYAYTYLARVPSCQPLVLLSHSGLWIVRYSSDERTSTIVLFRLIPVSKRGF